MMKKWVIWVVVVAVVLGLWYVLSLKNLERYEERRLEVGRMG